MFRQPRIISDGPALVEALRKANSDHKYTHGHAVILSGGPGKTGAARLAARGALRIGAGLVTIGCPQTALSEVAAQITAIMCRPLSGAAALAELLEDDRLNALCLGPGLGLGADTQQLVLTALAASNPVPAREPGPRGQKERGPGSSPGRGWCSTPMRSPGSSAILMCSSMRTHENVVLTPHAGEFKRLFPDIAEKLAAPAAKGPAYSKVDATREAAARAGCTVLFQGPRHGDCRPNRACCHQFLCLPTAPHRGWPPLGPATCWPVSSPASSLAASALCRRPRPPPGSTPNARCPSAPA